MAIIPRKSFALHISTRKCGANKLFLLNFAQLASRRFLATQTSVKEPILSTKNPQIPSTISGKALSQPSAAFTSEEIPTIPSKWEDSPNFSISQFSELPYSNFGINQHIAINDELKEALKQILWQFRAPIRYAFAYGSGVFPQSSQASSITRALKDSSKMVDFIFGVSHTQHWHSLNLAQHRDHYSFLGSLGSGAVAATQDYWGAGVYFNTHVRINGIMIKYGVVNIDTLCTDLSEWKTLYLAGRLQKPVKILRDDPRVRLANQVNLISALRTALLLLPSSFTEYELYSTITSMSYLGDLRMSLPTENPSKVANIVENNLSIFRQLYSPLLENLPNVSFIDSNYKNSSWISDPTTNLRLSQDMDPIKRGNMVRRLPKAFRSKLYYQYQNKYQIPQLEFENILGTFSEEDAARIKREGGSFEKRISNEPVEDLRAEVSGVIKSTVRWPSTSQTLKGPVTAGWTKTWRYLGEKIAKSRGGRQKDMGIKS